MIRIKLGTPGQGNTLPSKILREILTSYHIEFIDHHGRIYVQPEHYYQLSDLIVEESNQQFAIRRA
jgi:hypothetical protein